MYFFLLNIDFSHRTSILKTNFQELNFQKFFISRDYTTREINVTQEKISNRISIVQKLKRN